MLTNTQKKTAQAIVNIFETGSVLGDYGSVTIIPGDTGHLTFGRSQTTLGSGNLWELLDRYCSNHGSRFGNRLSAYQNRFSAGDLTLDCDLQLHNLLRATADDPVMRETQDQFFEALFWQPAEKAAGQLGITSPLGVAVVYDSYIHGSWKAIRDRTSKQCGSISSIGEKDWISAYVQIRHNWLVTNPNTKLQATGYRMESMQRLIDQNYWGLPLPLVVRGNEISLATLNATPPGCYDGPEPGTRILAVQSPLIRGMDVRLVQLGLSDRSISIKADGIFGQTSAKCIKDYQAKAGLPVTGVTDIALIAQLVSQAC
jgi:chitosanase